MAGEPDGPGSGDATTSPGRAGQPPAFDFIGQLDGQIAAKTQEIEETRRFEQYVVTRAMVTRQQWQSKPRAS